MLEVLGEAAVAVEPCQGELDDPGPREDFEAFCPIGTPDDFERPLASIAQCVLELVSVIAAIDLPVDL